MGYVALSASEDDPQRRLTHAQLDNEASLEATGSVWPKDLDPNWFSADKPRLLVGTKLDLRESGSATITASKAKKQMGPLKASRYRIAISYSH